MQQARSDSPWFSTKNTAGWGQMGSQGGLRGRQRGEHSSGAKERCLRQRRECVFVCTFILHTGKCYFMRPWLRKKAGDSLIWAEGNVNDIEHNVLSLHQAIYIIRSLHPSPANISLPSGIFSPTLPTTNFSEIYQCRPRGDYHIHTQR